MTQQEAKDAVIDAYRRHIGLRYTAENVRRFPELQDFPDAKVAEIRDFFLSHVYPEAGDRHILESAFEQLGSILKSPRKLMPLIGTMAASIFKLGTLIPSALAGGLRTLEAYLEIRRLESHMTQYALEHQLNARALENELTFAGMIASVPEKDIERFRRDMNKLFESLANSRLLTTTVEIMEHAIGVMEGKGQLYTPEEMAGIHVGYRLLTGGLGLFLQLSTEQIRMLQKGVDTIEMEWIHRIRALAGKTPVA